MILTLKTDEGIVCAEFKGIEKLDLTTSTGKEDRYILLSWLMSSIKEGLWLDQNPRR